MTFRTAPYFLAAGIVVGILLWVFVMADSQLHVLQTLDAMRADLTKLENDMDAGVEKLKKELGRLPEKIAWPKPPVAQLDRAQGSEP